MFKNITILFFLFIFIFTIFITPTHAQSIVDGDLIRESRTLDVYIVKLAGAKKFKR